ncbi:MAG: HTH-type transcriptional regulator / antitoxin HigA [Pseudomonadota bacterium]|nr:HTH-type transcriptional regulator / antitoxin HigA [Pseudomonadota bacterium]
MELKPIRNEADYGNALAEIERLWDAPEGSPEADQLEILTILVETYEKVRFPIEAPDPVAFIEYIMDSRGLTRRDLQPYIGPRGRVADILNRTRPLTMTMIRRLATGLNLPAEVLIQPYPLREITPI